MTQLTLPAVPDTVPIRVETSFSQHLAPSEWGAGNGYYCKVTRRPRGGDALAVVVAPGSPEYYPFLIVTLPADDLDDAEETAKYAVLIARQLIAALSGVSSAWDELRALLGPDGPMSGHSETTWFKVLNWMREARTPLPNGALPTLNI